MLPAGPSGQRNHELNAMNLSEAKAKALEKWFDPEFADLITYNGADIYGHVSYGGRNAPTALHATLTVKVSDVPAPAYRDPVIINGITWRVFQDEGLSIIIKGDGLTWDLPLARDEKPKAF